MYVIIGPVPLDTRVLVSLGATKLDWRNSDTRGRGEWVGEKRERWINCLILSRKQKTRNFVFGLFIQEI